MTIDEDATNQVEIQQQVLVTTESQLVNGNLHSDTML